MDLNHAVTKFNSYRANPLDSQDVQRIRAIVEELGLTEFVVVESGAYMRDKNSTIHINPGFIVSRKPASGLSDDRVYGDIGFLYRCWLSGQARHTSGETKLDKSHCPLCTGLPGDDHSLEECPRHP